MSKRRREKSPETHAADGPNASPRAASGPIRRRGNRSVNAVAWSAVVAMSAWQLGRVAGDESAAVTPAATASAGASGAPIDASVREAADSSATSGDRMREGTRLNDCVGHFRQNGDTVTFIDDQGHELGGLPNLTLERIVRMLKAVDEPESITWSINGRVTEFTGRNFVLISRAVYKASSPPPPPDLLKQ